MAKRSFYKAADAILGEIGGKASEEVILHVVYEPSVQQLVRFCCQSFFSWSYLRPTLSI